MYLATVARGPRFSLKFQFLATSSPKRRSALACSAATCVAFGVPCSLPPGSGACHGVSSASFEEDQPLPRGLRRALAWLGTGGRLHHRLAYAAAAACTVSMNAPQRAPGNKLHLPYS